MKLRNRWNYKGEDLWSWEAFIDDEGSGEFEKIDHVEYVLHPTFPQPIRRIDDPEGGFVMKTEGWGIFDLKAFVHMKDGSKKRLTHEIELKADPKTGTSG